jgi:predicted nucleotidyltransferase
VVLFGSWARGELAADSDVDLLVVVEGQVELRRALYREWDREPLDWEGRRIEPHFVHLPDSGHGLIGIWAEVALDGVVLFERGWEMSTRLSSIRRAIADGRIARRTVHGHAYWAEVA